MGRTFMGSDARQVGTADLLSPQQQQFLNSILGQVQGQVPQAYGNLLQGFDENLFQQGVVDPAMQAYEQQALPAISQQFGEAGLDSSSALNQALSRSAENLATTIGSQRVPFAELQQRGQLGALGQLGQLGTAQVQAPITQGAQSGLLQQILQGILPSLSGAAGLAGGNVLDRFLKGRGY